MWGHGDSILYAGMSTNGVFHTNQILAFECVGNGPCVIGARIPATPQTREAERIRRCGPYLPITAKLGPSRYHGRYYSLSVNFFATVPVVSMMPDHDLTTHSPSHMMNDLEWHR
jgi:hypothetical protein